MGDGELCGTTGRALGLEALQMSIAGMEGVGIEYSAMFVTLDGREPSVMVRQREQQEEIYR